MAMNRRHYSHRILSDLGEYDFNPRVRGNHNIRRFSCRSKFSQCSFLGWEYAYEEGVNSEHGCVGAMGKISIVEDDSGLWKEIQLDLKSQMYAFYRFCHSCQRKHGYVQSKPNIKLVL